MKPLAIDIFCGLGGWTEGLLAEGYDVLGFDIVAHEFNGHRYPAQLVLQDVLTLDGRQFKDATLIVASPPCTEFSYMFMPWRRAKIIEQALRGNGQFPLDYMGSRTLAELTALVDAAFRIQREASNAAGRRIPMVLENVKGAQPWIGRSRWSYGSFHLWGDVPALMPTTVRVRARTADSHIKQSGLAGRRENGKGARWFQDGSARYGSQSKERKAMAAMIAKIPFDLARHIARVYRPQEAAA